MTASNAQTVTRTYGNWRRSRGLGIGQLSGGQTLTLFLAVLVPILCFSFSPVAGLVAGAGSILIAAAVLIRIDGQSAADLTTRRARFGRARRAGWLELSGGVLAEFPRGDDLPGPMAPIVPLATDDGLGGKQGLLWDRRTGWLTAVIRVSPVGLDLADRSQADIWVASFGAWLATLGYQPMIRHLAVTTDTAPSGGASLRDYIDERLDPDAPASAQAILRELAASAPESSADVDTRVSITFDPSRAHPRPTDLLGAAAEVTRWLPGIEASLSTVGVTVLGRASVEWLAGRLRLAYDPASRGFADRSGPPEDEMRLWGEAGPIRGQEDWNHWRHDSGISVAWALNEAPRAGVADRILIPLLAPGPFPRRVTMLYEPFPAGDASSEVEREIISTQVRQQWSARTKRDETQRDRDDRARALQAAREEASGAGVGKFCLYVSTTVANEQSLAAATADVDQRAGQCKIRLRRLHGANLAGFSATLGMGINPAELAHRSRR
jgi:hypothetical protein